MMRTPPRSRCATDDAQSPLKVSGHSALLRQARQLKRRNAHQRDRDELRLLRQRLDEQTDEKNLDNRDMYSQTERNMDADETAEQTFNNVDSLDATYFEEEVGSESAEQMYNQADLDDAMKRGMQFATNQYQQQLEQAGSLLDEQQTLVKTLTSKLAAVNADNDKLKLEVKGATGKMKNMKTELEVANEKNEKLKKELEKSLRAGAPAVIVAEMERLKSELEAFKDSVNVTDDDESPVDSDELPGYGEEDSEFVNEFAEDDTRISAEMRRLECLRCPFFQGCTAEMTSGRAGPACEEDRVCSHCELPLVVRGRYGRVSRSCARHRKFLCLPCAHVALQRQLRSDLSDG